MSTVYSLSCPSATLTRCLLFSALFDRAIRTILCPVRCCMEGAAAYRALLYPIYARNLGVQRCVEREYSFGEPLADEREAMALRAGCVQRQALTIHVICAFLTDQSGSLAFLLRGHILHASTSFLSDVDQVLSFHALQKRYTFGLLRRALRSSTSINPASTSSLTAL